jgi:hypothetical protein
MALKLATEAGKTTVMADANCLADGKYRTVPPEQPVYPWVSEGGTGYHHIESAFSIVVEEAMGQPSAGVA